MITVRVSAHERGSQDFLIDGSLLRRQAPKLLSTTYLQNSSIARIRHINPQRFAVYAEWLKTGAFDPTLGYRLRRNITDHFERLLKLALIGQQVGDWRFQETVVEGLRQLNRLTNRYPSLTQAAKWHGRLRASPASSWLTEIWAKDSWFQADLERGETEGISAFLLSVCRELMERCKELERNTNDTDQELEGGC